MNTDHEMQIFDTLHQQKEQQPDNRAPMPSATDYGYIEGVGWQWDGGRLDYLIAMEAWQKQ
jgi:hypothetical protein